MSETWRPIPGYEGTHEASSEGRIRSLLGIRSGRGQRTEPRILTGWVNNRTGYHIVSIPGPQRVHRLVCMAFHGLPTPERPDVRHLDGDRLNNRPENLAWGTPAENSADIKRHGRLRQGAKNHATKLTDEQVLDIFTRATAGGLGVQRDLADEFGVSQATVSAIVLGRYWSHVTGVTDYRERVARKRSCGTEAVALVEGEPMCSGHLAGYGVREEESA